MRLPVGSRGSFHGKLPVHRSRVSGMSLPMRNLSLTVIKAKSLLHTNDWKTEHEGHFYFVLFPLCGMWLQCKHPFNQGHKGSHLGWVGGSQSLRTQSFFFFFPFCCRTFLQAVISGSCWTLPHLPLDEEKDFPKGQFESKLSSTTWESLKANICLL